MQREMCYGLLSEAWIHLFRTPCDLLIGREHQWYGHIVALARVSLRNMEDHLGATRLLHMVDFYDVAHDSAGMPVTLRVHAYA